ncbi:MAG TPA: NAD(P)/FAD-dependent oxidoreductase [Candidatus Acidoferrum sp.]|nr:NAD(P)/FAD-dependent oxidoreductase [Candidatus Acidoferrum sp.]
MINKRTAIIVGAGPAGLTAAFELVTRTNIRPIVLERSTYMGGISRTINYKGNRMDMGGHRFFSKSDRVMEWWLQRLPMAFEAGNERRNGQMLVRSRVSRIYFLNKFFDYPIQLSRDTLMNLGLWRTLRIGLSYMRSVIFPPKKVENLEQFFISRFGRELYDTFFKSYTEKVWGIACTEISAEWGAQRIKGLSIRRAIQHFLKQLARKGKTKSDIAQKDTEVSLIEQFLYPKYGPGQMWEEVARQVIASGGQIVPEIEVTGVEIKEDRVTAITGKNAQGKESRYVGDYFFSTTSIQELVRFLKADVPANVREVSEGLQYRDFITIGLLLMRLKIQNADKNGHNLIADNWIYLQDPDILAGRLQIFNNWSPYLVADPTKVWVGVEYFCREGDDLWRRSDQEMADLAIAELDKIKIIDKSDVLDFTVARMPKTYPAYFGAYERFGEVREYLDRFKNLFLIGRNGMHKYNNQDHSMLTAMVAVDNIVEGRTDKSNIWDVNTEMEYHEAKQTVAKHLKVSPAIRSEIGRTEES